MAQVLDQVQALAQETQTKAPAVLQTLLAVMNGVVGQATVDQAIVGLAIALHAVAIVVALLPHQVA